MPQGADDFGARAIAAFEHPDQFQHDSRGDGDERRSFEQALRALRLGRVVVEQVAQQQVGVEDDHGRLT